MVHYAVFVPNIMYIQCACSLYRKKFWGVSSPETNALNLLTFSFADVFLIPKSYTYAINCGYPLIGRHLCPETIIHLEFHLLKAQGEASPLIPELSIKEKYFAII